jgi:hypothetical protein
MVGKSVGWSTIALVFLVVIIAVASALWYASTQKPSALPSPSPSPTPNSPFSSPTQTETSTPNPSSTSNSLTPTPHVSNNLPAPTASPNSTPQPTPSPSPSQSPSPTPTVSPTPAPSIIAIFDFDTGTPILSPGLSTPIDQTSNGVTAHFSSPTDSPSHPAFSVQNLNSLAAISTVINSVKFSGLFLWPSTINRDRLDITFSVNITSVSFDFKTAELHDPGPGGTGSPIKLTAYLNSFSTSVGTPTTVNGIETQLDNYPEGTLSFNSNGQPFNIVEIDLPYVSAEGATGFIIDNITVITK